MRICINFIILIAGMIFSSFQFDISIKLKYQPQDPKIYFYNNEVLIESDTVSLMKLIRNNYAESRANQIKNEIDYRIINAERDSVMLDGLTLHLYIDQKRMSYEAAVLNHGEVSQLIKSGCVKLYDKKSKSVITNIAIKREGNKKKYNIDEVFYDKSNGKEIARINIYNKQY